MLNIYNLTDTQRQILNNQIIERYCKYHNININYNIKPDFQNNEKKETVAMWLQNRRMIIPKEWIHDSTLKDYLNRTVAMIQAFQGKIPDNQWRHDKYLCCKHITDKNVVSFYTVQRILQLKNIEVPDEWFFEMDVRVENMEMIEVINGQIPELGDNNPIYQNVYGNTIALILLKSGIIIPRYWMHDINLENKYNQTIKSISQNKQFPVPYHWKDSKMTIFDQAYFKIIPDIKGHKPNEQDEDGFTVAMILAYNNIQIPKEWYHKPEIQNNYGDTVAMILARNKIKISEQWYHNPNIKNKQNQTVAMLVSQFCEEIPEQQWNHDPNFQDIEGWTVAMHLIHKKLVPPRHWIHNINLQNKDGNTLIMLLTMNSIIPPKQMQHDPNIQNADGQTVAMILISTRKIIPSEQWHHKPELQDKNGQTVAMYIAQYLKQIPPKEWEHDQQLQDNNGYTVARFLAEQHILPSKQWLYDSNEQTQNNSIVKYLLYQIGYFYKDGQFITNYKTQILNDMCQICFNEGKQEFIVTKCGHQICFNCFKEMQKENNIRCCPICRKDKQYKQLYQYQ